VAIDNIIDGMRPLVGRERRKTPPLLSHMSEWISRWLRCFATSSRWRLKASSPLVRLSAGNFGGAVAKHRTELAVELSIRAEAVDDLVKPTPGDMGPHAQDI
jgi:hypothetical protein